MTAPTKPLGIIERINRAATPDEVKELVAHGVGFELRNPQVLRRINRAAVKRNKELSK